ncbi:unnamed protein product [Arabis nemorensis]|uniref:Uncharacterized protein n=1 Tax=Arabis nemorensis TaxID=586526 RepID=A0A565B5A4_9BRAS|nr:unnamed protein product [Arabis nemorensis]
MDWRIQLLLLRLFQPIYSAELAGFCWSHSAKMRNCDLNHKVTQLKHKAGKHKCEQLEQMEQFAGYQVVAAQVNKEQMGEYAGYKMESTQAYNK